MQRTTQACMRTVCYHKEKMALEHGPTQTVMTTMTSMNILAVNALCRLKPLKCNLRLTV